MNDRVLHIISGLGQGGAERQLIELVKQNSSHAICSLTSGGYFEEEAKKNGIALWSLGMEKNIYNLIFIFRFKKIISIFKPHLIHCWMYHACLATVFFKFLFTIKIPIIWGIRCSDMDTSKYSYKLKLTILCCKFFSKNVNSIVYNSESGRDFHTAIGFSRKNDTVISNGIAIENFKPDADLRKKIRKVFKIEHDKRVLINVARFDPMKGHNTLINVFNNIRSKKYKAILILAGSNTDKLKVPQGVIALGQYEKIEEIYSIGDIIISSSEYGEGFSNALAEGMSSGLIPIATDVGDSKKIIKNIGILVNRKNSDQLTNAVIRMLKLNDKDLVKKKMQARESIKNNFSLQSMIVSYQDLYSKINRDSLRNK